MSFSAGVAAVVMALLPAVTPDVSLAMSGDAVAAIWSRVPAHQLISGPVDGFGAIIAFGLQSIGLEAVSTWLNALGPALLGALVPIGAVFAIYSRGVGSWRVADAAERQEIRREKFGRGGRAWARSEAVLLVGGLTGVVIAAGGPPVGIVLGWVVGVALVALVVRRS